MEDVFITKLDIVEVRHLKDITINLDEKERKHLILTGRNGSGKTSTLEAIKSFLEIITNTRTRFFNTGIGELKEKREELANLIEQSKSGHNSHIETIKISREEIKICRDYFSDKLGGLLINIDIESLTSNYKLGNFILAYFPSKRLADIKIPKGISKITFKQKNEVEERLNQDFVQYIVNLKAQRSFARDDEDTEVVKNIDKWFTALENSFKNIFEDDTLQLIFEREEYNFYFQFKNGNKVNINQLSDGYSAILSIVTELIMRMANKSPFAHDMQGIVLIDEIEAHLHVDLQKKILPFLTSFFPRIQFIVSTHSPFVISSNKDCVIYDLDQNLRIEDATGYSYDTIIESYFDSDKYSTELKARVEEYEELLAKKELSETEQDRLLELKLYLKRIPTDFALELGVKLQQLELQQLNHH